MEAIKLHGIPPTTIEELLNVTLPLLTGLKYKTKIRKIKNNKYNPLYNIELEIDESSPSSSTYESLKENFQMFIDNENFQKRYQDAKDR